MPTARGRFVLHGEPMRAWVIFALASVSIWLSGCDRKVAGGRADGAEIYSKVCARCHGYQGVPNEDMASGLGVTDLSSATFHERVTDAELRARIVRGSANRRMPAFGDVLTDDQLDAVVRHVRALRR